MDHTQWAAVEPHSVGVVQGLENVTRYVRGNFWWHRGAPACCPFEKAQQFRTVDVLEDDVEAVGVGLKVVELNDVGMI